MKETPLIRAAHNGHLNTVQCLLQAGCQVNAIDLGDNTALHWASMRGHVEVVRALLAAGADKELRNAQVSMPPSLAILHSLQHASGLTPRCDCLPIPAGLHCCRPLPVAVEPLLAVLQGDAAGLSLPLFREMLLV